MTAAFSQRTMAEHAELVANTLTRMQKSALLEFADRGPAEDAMVTIEFERRKAKKHGDAITEGAGAR
jgi:hypothetical protein